MKRELSSLPPAKLSEPMADYPLSAATAESTPGQVNMLARARAFAEPLIADEMLDTGENTLAHADAVAAIVAAMGGSEAMQAASYLVYSCQHLNKPQEVIAKVFGDNFAALAVETTKLVHVQKQARSATGGAHADGAGSQTENVRKMLLAFSRDLRVVMLRLASRLQTLRHAAASKQPVSESVARESLQVFAPLANRLGIWQVKWEIEDLSFRFLEPDTYQLIARLLDEKRTEREGHIEQLRSQLERDLAAQGVNAKVQGRPKNIYSIVKKMRGKSLDFAQVFDILALRVVVQDVKDCYAALAWVHTHFQPIDEEFDDYIARPKANGYQSLHTVVREVLEGQTGKPIEIQIRTEQMHDHAEHGVAAHWAYKEAGPKGYAGVWAGGEYDAKIAVLRQLLAWERDLSDGQQGRGLFDDRIYVLTPDAAIVELPQGATAVDFAYTVHTTLGHRCRGARIDGAMVPLNTPLQNGQTVEIIAAKEGGPSRDWLNAELGYLASHRARAKVRAWFNAQVTHETVARGREAVEKLLQREGKTALKLDDLASRLGFKSADDLFEVVGKDEFSLRTIEALLRPPEPAPGPDDGVLIRKSRATEKATQGGVLVVGVSSLMTQLAKCCRPAPPDAIAGFVTRGHGVSIHRADCSNFRTMASHSGERVIEVEWGAGRGEEGAVYAVDVAVEASDRQGLLRDISEVFAREKMNVIGVQTQSVKGTAWMTFTIEIADAARLAQVLRVVADVSGVRHARRR
ncbi:MAG: bifunctional (p)ppGpp synthetase/guanosine-3',5'-bis(diphosphate) 3'-pyrophosphohydrolase [Variovorax sp.]|nr:MAG: bifunctional (p)ppGpp synthetase/guanosine-3',5'-bis(diphosphate) 3'-pyrophosphohydrolase [Variovorax sp.]